MRDETMSKSGSLRYCPGPMRTESRHSTGRAHRLASIHATLALCVGLALLPHAAAAAPASATPSVGPEAALDEVGDDAHFLDEAEPAEALAEEQAYDALFDDDFDLELDDVPAGFPDPFEKFNRGILAFNSVVDQFVMDPITIGYRFIFPEPVRRSIERFFDNINSTQTLVNDLFQLEWKDAGITTGRLLVNSTVGIGGLFDPAVRMGMPSHGSDFGQTLAIAGAPSGPYFMLPLLGPSNVRDGLGIGVDAIFHPTFFVLAGADVLFFSGSSGLTERARHYDELKALEESSIDYYAALRSGYFQNREAEIWDRRQHRREPGPVETARARSPR
jgi:phospholipid-binding lipoprotein MlaA